MITVRIENLNAYKIIQESFPNMYTFELFM